MKPKYEERIEIIPKIDGDLVATLTWREHIFQEILPRGIDRWPEVEFKSHLKNHVIPRLRLELLKAQRQALDDGSVPVEECVPVAEYTDADMQKLQIAQDKRDRRSAKLKEKLN